MSILWEKNETWRWIVRKTRDSNPFFLSFATLCRFVPGDVGYGVVQHTNSRNEQLEAQLRQNARPTLSCWESSFPNLVRQRLDSGICHA